MSEQVQQLRQVNDDGTTTTKTTRVIDNDTVTSAAPVRRTTIASRIISFIAGVIIVLLAFRFVFVLLGANPANSFAHFIYTVSHPFAAPFFGLFGYTIHYGISRFELSTLVAILVYAIVGYGLARLFSINKQP